MRRTSVIPELFSKDEFFTKNTIRVKKVFLDLVSKQLMTSTPTFDALDLVSQTNDLNDWIYRGITNPTIRVNLRSCPYVSTFLSSHYYPNVAKFINKITIQDSIDILWFLSSVTNELPAAIACKLKTKIDSEYTQVTNTLQMCMLYRCLTHFSIRANMNFLSQLYTASSICNGYEAISSILILGRIPESNRNEFWTDTIDNFAFRMQFLNDEEERTIFSSTCDRDYWAPKLSMASHILWDSDNNLIDLSRLDGKRPRSNSDPLSFL